MRHCSVFAVLRGFTGAAVLLADPDQSLIFTAGAGDGIEVMKALRFQRSKIPLETKSRRRGAGQFVRRAIEKRFFVSDVDVTPLSLAPPCGFF
jgi:hypothetical protein